MLLGWLFGAGVLGTGNVKSEINRNKAQQNGEDTYVSSDGIIRYTENKLPYNESYEKIKNKHSERRVGVRVWQKALDEELAKDNPNPVFVKICKDNIREEEEKADHLDQFMSKYDAYDVKRLKKQGYKF